MGFPKKLLGEDEVLVLVLRPHIKRLVGPVLLLLVIAPLAGYLAALVPDGALAPWLRAAVAVAVGLVLLRWTLWPFLVWWNTVYAVTSRRLVMRQGVFSRSGHDMPLTRLNDVSFSHGMIERMLGCGTLVVESAGEHGQILLRDIPRVESVQATLFRLVEEEQRRLERNERNQP
jgi:uncharacterized membrane protein YdbT with pleckstrin-like domain